jgi:hypothetical protein
MTKLPLNVSSIAAMTPLSQFGISKAKVMLGPAGKRLVFLNPLWVRTSPT